MHRRGRRERRSLGQPGGHALRTGEASGGAQLHGGSHAPLPRGLEDVGEFPGHLHAAPRHPGLHPGPAATCRARAGGSRPGARSGDADHGRHQRPGRPVRPSHGPCLRRPARGVLQVRDHEASLRALLLALLGGAPSRPRGPGPGPGEPPEAEPRRQGQALRGARPGALRAGARRPQGLPRHGRAHAGRPRPGRRGPAAAAALRPLRAGRRAAAAGEAGVLRAAAGVGLHARSHPCTGLAPRGASVQLTSACPRGR
mmetsp:Transcript_121040/g.353721  ORF Transcript_121040/g.353721 Transcript_121040/m.353721 type:complete len:256 (-) Transcript_121040:127-894(-)